MNIQAEFQNFKEREPEVVRDARAGFTPPDPVRFEIAVQAAFWDTPLQRVERIFTDHTSTSRIFVGPAFLFSVEGVQFALAPGNFSIFRFLRPDSPEKEEEERVFIHLYGQYPGNDSFYFRQGVSLGSDYVARALNHGILKHLLAVEHHRELAMAGVGNAG